MKNTLFVLFLLPALLYAAVVLSSQLREPYKPRQIPSHAPPALVTNLASYDFDDGMGGPDPQGWVSIDLSAQTDTFSHVDDFAGMSSSWAPNEGTNSYWVGTRAEGPEFCNWVNPPGYGNNWSEHLESVAFTSAGDVTFSYQLSYDTEQGYDFFYVDYLSKSNRWNELVEYSGPTFLPERADTVGTHVIPADSLDGSVRFRFKFYSDVYASDEDGVFVNPDTDGAALIDSITVADTTGVIDYEDWEDAPFGAKVSTDGDWFSGSTSYFGDWAGLFDGTTVVQEDSATTNSTYFWGFFNGSPDTYACGGFPGQPSIPLQPVSGYASPRAHIRNGIVSPVIDLRRDLNGDPVPGPPDQVVIAYDVYVDAVAGNQVFYGMAIRFMTEDCFSATWVNRDPINLGPQKAWHRQEHPVNVHHTWTHVQYILYVVDYGDDGVHTCNSHAPMFDNVTVDGWFDTVTGVRSPGNAAYVLHKNTPNPFNPTTTIGYEVPPGGGTVRLSVFNVLGRRIATLFDGYRPEGSYEARWDGRNSSGNAVGSGIYFYRLDAPGFTASRKMVLLK
jgi:hypothetical protein